MKRSDLFPALAVGLILILPIALAHAVPQMAAAAESGAAEGEEAPEGKLLFLAKMCNLCHAIESEGIERKTKSEKMKGPDLSDTGSKRDAELLVKYLKQQEEIDGEEHDKEFKGTDEEAAKVANWLVGLKAENGNEDAE